MIDVTVSGEKTYSFATPYGQYHSIIDENNIFYPEAWTPYNNIHKFKVNALQIVRFTSVTLPVFDIEIKKKNVSKLYSIFWEGYTHKLYDIKIRKISDKTVTIIVLATGEHFYIDEDITLIENAINSFNTETHNETKN